MSPPPPCSIDDELHFGILITNFVAVILSLVYLYEQEVEDHRKERLHRIADIISIAATFPTHVSFGEEEEDDENHEDISNETAGNEGVATERPRKKRRFISWDRERARDAIFADYLGRQPSLQQARVSTNVPNISEFLLAT